MEEKTLTKDEIWDILDKYFDDRGHVICSKDDLTYFDPYRRDDHPLYDALFTEDGDTTREADKWISWKIHQMKGSPDFDPFSDVMHIYYADIHGSNTKGSYPAIYMWR